MTGLRGRHGDLLGLCGGTIRIVASIEDPAIIEWIMVYLDAKQAELEATRRMSIRVLRLRGLLDATEYPTTTSVGRCRQRYGYGGA